MKTTLLKKKIFPILIIGGLAYSGIAAILYGNNPPAAMTNAPNESNCTSCHGGSLNPTPANLTNLTLTGSFTGGGYIPDSSYSITLSYSQSGINKYGFELTALRTDNDAPVGSLTAGTGSATATQSVNGATRSYIRHTSSGTSGSGSKSWTFTWKAPSSNVDTITFYAVVNAANGNGQSSGDQIYAKEFKIPTSSLLPTAIIQTSKSTVCAGDTMTLYGSGTNSPTSYRWKFNQGFPQTVTTQNVVRSYPSVGTFSDTLWVFNAKGESKPVRHLTTVGIKPSASIPSISPGVEVCDGDSITMTANAGSGFKYDWNTGNPADTLQSLTVYKGGAYEVTVSNSNGCSRISSAVSLTFKAQPNSGLTSSTSKDTLCLGDSMFVFADTGFVNYDFFNGAIVVQSGSSNKLELNQVGTYSIKVKADNGTCKALSTATINKVFLNRLPAPIISCGNTTTNELNFHWNPIPGANSYSYTISGSGSNVSTTDTFVQITGLSFNSKQTIMVQAIGTGPCSEGLAAVHSCTTLPCSQFTYDIVISDTLACEGDSISLDINNISLTNYSVAFNGGAASSTKHLDFIADPFANVYTIDVLDLNSPTCPAFTIKDSIMIEEKVIVPIGISAAEICLGESVLISNQSFYNQYTLFVNSIFREFNSTGSFVVDGLADGDMLLVKAQGLACLQESAPQTITVNTPRKPGYTVSGNNRTWDFTDTTTGIQSRTWNFGDNSATQSTATVSHTYASNGAFDVRLITADNNGCMDSAKQTINSDNVGMMDIIMAQVKVYPNPASDFLQIESAMELDAVELWTLTGQRIAIKTNQSTKYEFELSGMAPGTYLIKLKWNDQESLVRFIKE